MGTSISFLSSFKANILVSILVRILFPKIFTTNERNYRGRSFQRNGEKFAGRQTTNFLRSHYDDHQVFSYEYASLAHRQIYPRPWEYRIAHVHALSYQIVAAVRED